MLRYLSKDKASQLFFSSLPVWLRCPLCCVCRQKRVTRMTVVAERAERAQASCLHNAKLTWSLVEAWEGGNAHLSHQEQALFCWISGAKCWMISLTVTVHARRHTKIYSTHINICMLRRNRGPKVRPASEGPAGSWLPVLLMSKWSDCWR